ncbi:MAG: hypothetical protein IJV18_06425 [Acidaminococcaceae bacterium]|nr:hypothetical protein [Acidaminococcaceae bacterium]
MITSSKYLTKLSVADILPELSPAAQKEIAATVKRLHDPDYEKKQVRIGQIKDWLPVLSLPTLNAVMRVIYKAARVPEEDTPVKHTPRDTFINEVAKIKHFNAVNENNNDYELTLCEMNALYNYSLNGCNALFNIITWCIRYGYVMGNKATIEGTYEINGDLGTLAAIQKELLPYMPEES